MSMTNLWEALIDKSVSPVEDKYRREQWDEYLIQLGRTACLSYQELSLHPDERGWIIKIFGCNENGKVEILIPSDRTKPVEILKDTRSESRAYERY